MKYLLIVLILLAGTLSQAQQRDSNITVEGKASIKVTPELIFFQVTITERDTSYGQCAQLALNKIERVKQEFQKRGLDEKMLKTQDYSIQEERKHDRQLGQSVFSGYRADIRIIIESEVPNTSNNQIFDIIKDHFTGNTRIYYGLSDKQRDGLKEKIIDLAVKDAVSKAKILVNSADVKLGSITDIQYGNPQIVANLSRPKAELLSAVSVADSQPGTITSLSPNQIQMSTRVVVAWEIVEE